MSRQRKTTDLFVVQGAYGQGWEDVTTETTRPEGLARLREYRAESQYAHRLIVRRVPRFTPTDVWPVWTPTPNRPWRLVYCTTGERVCGGDGNILRFMTAEQAIARAGKLGLTVPTPPQTA